MEPGATPTHQTADTPRGTPAPTSADSPPRPTISVANRVELPDPAFRALAWLVAGAAIGLALLGFSIGILRSGRIAISWLPFSVCLLLVAAPGLWAAYQLARRGQPGVDTLRAVNARPIARVAQGTCLALGFLALTHLVSGGSFIAHVFKHGQMTAMFIGFSLIGASFLRVGGLARCANCDYPRPATPLTPDLLDDRCPECGSYWRREGGWVIGKKKRSVPMLVTGIALAALPFIHSALMFSAAGPRVSGFALRALPTDALIAEVTRIRAGFTTDEWTELSTRTLTPDQHQRLIAGLITARKGTGYLDRAGEAFLEKAALSGEMTPADRERFFAEMIDTALIPAPTPGETPPFRRLGVEAEFRGNLSFPANTTLRTRVLFAGYSVPNDPTPHLRQSIEIDALAFGTSRIRLRERQAGDLPTFTPPPGTDPSQVRAILWVVVAPWNIVIAPLQWNEQGEPILPPEVVWAERRELKLTTP